VKELVKITIIRTCLQQVRISFRALKRRVSARHTVLFNNKQKQ